jgi:hypothetical protein
VGARALAAGVDARRLEQVDLSRNELTEAGIAALTAAGIPVNVVHQHASTGSAPTKDVVDPKNWTTP